MSGRLSRLPDFSYLANGTKTSSLTTISGDSYGLIYRGPFIFRQRTDSAWVMDGVECPEGKLTESTAFIYLKDHLGSVKDVVEMESGEVVESSDYSSYGERSLISTAEYGSERNGVTLRAHFTGKEDQMRDFSLGYTDFGARFYSPRVRRWLTPDPLSEKYYGISPYAYCNGNPINFVDPDGRRKIPLHGTYNGWFVKVDSWFGKRNTNIQGASTFHRGLDFNYSCGGNNDKGSPILATHDGIVYAHNNNDGGAGRYVTIISIDGKVKTKYFHLDTITVSPGDFVTESTMIGTMGGSAKDKDNTLISHLLYEIWVYQDDKWVNINPSTDGSNTLKSIFDPQSIVENPYVNGGQLEPVIVEAPAPQMPDIKTNVKQNK